jgi:hypothetical protein
MMMGFTGVERVSSAWMSPGERLRLLLPYPGVNSGVFVSGFNGLEKVVVAADGERVVTNGGFAVVGNGEAKGFGFSCRGVARGLVTLRQKATEVVS